MNKIQLIEKFKEIRTISDVIRTLIDFGFLQYEGILPKRKLFNTIYGERYPTMPRVAYIIAYLECANISDESYIEQLPDYFFDDDVDLDSSAYRNLVNKVREFQDRLSNRGPHMEFLF